MSSTDWARIPLHMRCTQRNWIDEKYPADDARWWSAHEKRGDAMYGDQHGKDIGRTELMERVLDVLEAGVEMSQSALAQQLGVTGRAVERAMNGLTAQTTVYEFSREIG